MESEKEEINELVKNQLDHSLIHQRTIQPRPTVWPYLKPSHSSVGHVKVKMSNSHQNIAVAHSGSVISLAIKRLDHGPRGHRAGTDWTCGGLC